MEDKKPEKKGFSRLSSLLNLCPAVLVVVLIVIMLPATSPVLGEIPELLAIHADAAYQEESELGSGCNIRRNLFFKRYSGCYSECTYRRKGRNRMHLYRRQKHW